MFYQKKPLISKKLRSYLKKILPKSIYFKFIGRHERKSIEVWKLLSLQVSKEFSILDIGAFHGEYALAARSVNKLSRIYAFEPNPLSLAVLQQVCKDRNIKVVRNAVSSENKIVSFQCNSQISSITSKEPNSNTVKVYSITLDLWSKSNNEFPKLIKIDVEAFADQVVEGALFILKTYKPVFICEILNNQIGESIKSVIMDEYNFFCINENLGLEMKTSIERYDWRYKNWLFIPKENNLILSYLQANKIQVFYK